MNRSFKPTSEKEAPHLVTLQTIRWLVLYPLHSEYECNLVTWDSLMETQLSLFVRFRLTGVHSSKKNVLSSLKSVRSCDCSKNLQTSHIVVLFLLQLYKTERHFFYSLYINKLHKFKICEISPLLYFFTILKSLFWQLHALKGTILPRNVSIFREMFKGTERYFNVPSGVS